MGIRGAAATKAVLGHIYARKSAGIRNDDARAVVALITKYSQSAAAARPGTASDARSHRRMQQVAGKQD